MRATLVFVLFFVFAILVFFTAFLYLGDALTNRLSSVEFLSIFSSLVTIFAFIIACYFGVIAISAYGHIRNIGRQSAEAMKVRVEAEAQLLAIRRVADQVAEMQRHFGDYLGEATTIISEIVTDLRPSEGGDYVARLRLSSQRFVFASAVDDRARLNAAREIVQLGDREDLYWIESYLSTSDAADASALVRELHKRLRQGRH